MESASARSVRALARVRSASLARDEADREYRTAILAAVASLSDDPARFAIVAREAGVSRAAVRQLTLRAIAREQDHPASDALGAGDRAARPSA